MIFRLRCAIPHLVLVCAAALPLPAVTLGFGTVSIDGTEAITGPTRVNRFGIPSILGVQKPFPGTSTCFGNCRFRTITVTPTLPNINVKVTGVTTGLNVFTVAYLNSFNAASLSTNYLGDAGMSSATGVTVSFDVTVPAGNQLVLAFMNTIVGTTGTVTYEITQSAPPSLTGVPAVSPLMLALLAILLAAGAALTLRPYRIGDC